MKVVLPNWWHRIFAVLLVSISLAGTAAGLELVSVRSSSLNPSASANGDSGLPIISPDGRYVLFTSTADNLVLTTNSNPVSGLLPPSLNVFLRDRTNGTTTLVSVNFAGTGGGNGDSLPMGISTNGRYALFESSAGDLVAGDTNNTGDVFVRDLVSGTTMLVSVSTNGKSGNGISRSSVMTPDGRYVAFVSAATNLVPDDTNGIPDVFVRDLQTGTTTLGSVGAQSTGSSTLPSTSESPGITSDGRYVAFYSTATNLVPGITTAGDIYVRDLVAGTTVCASTSARTIFQLVMGATNAVSFNHAISADGAFVAFETSSNAPTPPTSSYVCGMIFRYNRQTGLIDIVHANASVPAMAFENIHSLDMTPDGRFIAFVANANGVSWTNTAVFLWNALDGISTLVSGDLNNTMPLAGTCYSPVIDPSGQCVAFVSTATNLTTNVLVGNYHLYLRNMQAGTTSLVNVDTNGIGSGLNPTMIPSLSSGGSLVAFECLGGRLATNDCNHADDVFVRDVTMDATELISVRDPNLPSQTPNGPSGFSTLSVSSNGLYVAFTSEADNLTVNDTNGCRDVFVRDLLAGTNILASVNADGVAGTGISTEPAISGNGRYVAFTSYATNLVAGDANKVQDVFLRDLQSGTTVLVSISTNGGFGDGDSYSPAISADGRYVLFRSAAKNLAPSPSGSYIGGNIFLRDMAAGTNCAFTTDGGSSPYMTPDGRYVAFESYSTSHPLYVWDTQLARRIYTNLLYSTYVSFISMSSDGHWLTYITPSPTQLIAVDLIARTNCLVSNVSLYSHIGLQFSGDGRFLAYATTATNVLPDTNATMDIYLYDFQTGTNLLISRRYDASGTPNGASDSPAISPDGRFVAYRSFASNCVPGDFNEVPDVFLYDRLTGATTLLSLSRSITATANNRSLMPVFSGDGQTLVFQSWASDLLAGDGNEGSDLFALKLSAPAITDSDGDSMDDQWELDYFTTLARDGTGDFDGDGATDLFEFQTGTDPTDRASVFRAEIVYTGTAGQDPVITWPLAPGKSYRVQFKNSLDDPDWQDLNGNVILMDGTGYATDLAPAAGQRFYRIVLVNN